MRRAFYARLSLSGMYKNRQIYLPYLLTCVGMIMMYYIIFFLSVSPSVAAMYGGDDAQMILGIGTGVMATFSVIFLFYTNSFLMRRRKKEFGLYNILGMGKGHIFRVLLWETLFSAVFALIVGLLCGILFSKLAELCMAKLLGSAVSHAFLVEWPVVRSTVVLFVIIFTIMLLNGIRQVYVAKPVELLGSETAGEKPPKANWFLALLGLAMLSVAYYFAVTIEEPLTALLTFFVAVVLVILGTYLLFVAGSVALCRLLQKRKNYYYKTSHFVSVSSMAYRMKKNGTGLASICILSTMVLVMVSSTACLFFGTESALRHRFPREMVFKIYSVEESRISQVKEAAAQVVASHGLLEENVIDYHFLGIGAFLKDDEAILDMERLEDFSFGGYENVTELYFIPLQDYNRLMGENRTLASGEALIHCERRSYAYDTITVEGCAPIRVKEQLDDFAETGIDTMNIIPSIFIVMDDEALLDQIYELQTTVYGSNASAMQNYFAFDVHCDDEEMTQLMAEIREAIKQEQLADAAYPHVSSECIGEHRNGFYALYGGLFFLGILLGAVFLVAAVLIIYYKQISEGYEDRARFVILEKVGMTKKEIKKSINSQVLTVFFLPLVTAGVHLAFAFPIITRLLELFGLFEVPLLCATAGICYLLFAAFYMLVYRWTSRAYYRIITSCCAAGCRVIKSIGCFTDCPGNCRNAGIVPASWSHPGTGRYSLYP